MNSEEIINMSLPVTGMSCAGCAVSVESMTANLPGVESAQVNYATQRLTLAFNPAIIHPPEIQKAVQASRRARLCGHHQSKGKL